MLGFWAGAIPFGVLLARLRGVDIRAHGSGNIGATNVTRVLGPTLGAIVLVLDARQGRRCPCGTRSITPPDPWLVVATGGAAIAGHCFSPFLEFKGGKGVATATGVFLVLAPAQLALAVVVFGAVLAWKRVPALGSLAAIASLAVMMLFRGEPSTATLALGTLVLLVYTHRSNLAGLRA